MSIAKIELFLWFGLFSDFKECQNLLPGGFKVKTWSEKENIPKILEYVEKHRFQGRVHIFQGRITLTSNVIGLPDTFVKVIILGNYKMTRVKKAMIDPIWDETLIFPEIYLYGTSEEIKKHPKVR